MSPEELRTLVRTARKLFPDEQRVSRRELRRRWLQARMYLRRRRLQVSTPIGRIPDAITAPRTLHEAERQGWGRA